VKIDWTEVVAALMILAFVCSLGVALWCFGIVAIYLLTH
jgi:hypothetical protein